MGINDQAGALTIIKQYGEYRTGSNALRALLVENFDNVLVLMHILGDKHHDAIDFTSLADSLGVDGVDSCRSILNCSWARPGGVTRPENFSQLAFVRAFADDVAASVRSGGLRVVLTVRHPLSWIEAVMRFWEWPAQVTGDPWLDAEGGMLARGLCRRFNARYTAWSKMIDELQERVHVVPFELLEADWRAVVVSLARAFPLHLRRGSPVNSGLTVQPSAWDNVPPCYSKSKHRKRAATRHHVRAELAAIVNDSIDWGLLVRFGYSREQSAHPPDGSTVLYRTALV